MPYGHHHRIPKEWRFWVVVEDGLVEMVGERLPLFLGVGVEAEVEKVRILLFASRKS